MIEWLLAGGLVASSGAFIALAFLNRKDNRELVLAQRTISDTQTLANEYKAQRDVEVAAHAVTRDAFAKEKALRIETDAALARARAAYEQLLRTNLKDASDDEIRAATAAAFAGFDGVSSPVPNADHALSGGLVDPFADVPPA